MKRVMILSMGQEEREAYLEILKGFFKGKDVRLETGDLTRPDAVCVKEADLIFVPEAAFIPYVRGFADADTPVIGACAAGGYDKSAAFAQAGTPVAVSSLMQAAVCLGWPKLLESKFFRSYARKTRELFGEMPVPELGNHYAGIRKKVSYGVICFLPDQICYVSPNAALLLGRTEEQLVGRSPAEIFPCLEMEADRLEAFGEQIVEWEDRELLFDVWLKRTRERYIGYLLLSDYRAKTQEACILKRKRLESRQRALCTFSDILGISPSIQASRELAEKFAASDAGILIQGPPGVGKELFANAIHNASERRGYPFVKVGCGAPEEAWLERELFGYEGEAAEGGMETRCAGAFEKAYRGTLFLEEVSELSFRLQARLLQALQGQEIFCAGAGRRIPVDVRIIAATRRNLKELVREGKFCPELYYRLNVLPLKLDGLAGRREDIQPLFSAFKEAGGYTYQLSAEAKEALTCHAFEGNVRELRNLAEYLGCLGKEEISAEDLHFDDIQIKKKPAPVPVPVREKAPEAPAAESKQEQLMAAIEWFWSQNINPGRRRLFQYLKESGREISEMEIRKLLNTLQNAGVIVVGTGRQGIGRP